MTGPGRREPGAGPRPGDDELKPARPRQATQQSAALLVYVLLLVSLQIFLLVVAIEGLAGDEPGLARAAAVLSAVLFASTLALRWFVDGT